MNKTLGIMLSLMAGTVGAFLLMRYLQKKNAPYHFTENWPYTKNFGEFPPEIPEGEFDGVDFLSAEHPGSGSFPTANA